MIRRLEAEDEITQALAGDRLGLPAVLFFVMSAAAPLTVVAGVLTTGYAVTGNVGLPSAFVVVGVVLALFSVGYVTMSRHLPHAGAFYAYVSHGVGKTFGVGAAWVALFAYNLLQVGLYGAVGVASAPLVKEWIGIELPWWVFALIAWVLVAVLGVFRVDINGKVLAVLLVIEVSLILVYDVSYLAHPAHGLDFSILSPTELFKPGVGAILAIAVLGFVGFESAVVFTEESRNPRRTVPVATYVSVVVIAGVYGLSAWAMAVSVGTEKIVQASREQGPEVLFILAGTQLGSPVAMLGRLLFVTSLIAAMISFHNTIARYGFALGRERVMPELFGGTSSSGAPRAGSMAQSAIALIVIVVYAVSGLDPLVQLFYTGGTSGALGILLLLGGACIAVLLFFARNRRGESLWHTVIAPVLATLGVGVILFLVLANFATLLGVEESSPLRWGIPASFILVGAGGVAYGLMLKIRRPQVYAAIGLGAKSAEVGGQSWPSCSSGARARRHGRRAPGVGCPVTDTAQIRVVAAEEIESVGQLIAITFHDDPVTRWLVDDEPDRRRIMPPYFTMLAALGLKGGTVYASGDHQAAAVWIDGTSPEPPPPDEPEPELSELTGRYIDRFHTLERMLHRAQLGLPPHQHLFFLAARPGVQRRGLGTALLDAHHRRLDREGLPAYLDASSLESRRLYKRHGYQDVRQPFTFADGPSMWPMWRPPGGRGRVPD